MKNHLTPALALTISLLAATAAQAADTAAPTWGLRDAPRLVTPTGLVAFTRDEIRAEKSSFETNVRGLKAGRPEALLKVGFLGARLAHVDGGALTAAQFAIHYATLDWAAPRPTLETALPAAVKQAPDHAFRDGVRGAAHGVLSGHGDAASGIAGGLRGEAIDLIPATLHSLHLGLSKALRSPANHSL